MLALAVFVLAPAISAPPETENLYRAARVGDWIEYTSTGASKVVGRQTVAAKTAEKLTLQIEQVVDGKAGEVAETVIDLKGVYPPVPKDPKPAYTVKTETLETGKETRTVRGRPFECAVLKQRTTYTPTGEGDKFVIVVKSWRSNEVPLGGLVRMETETDATKSVTELTGWGRGK